MRSVTSTIGATRTSTSTDRISTINGCSSPEAMGTSLLGFVISTSSERGNPLLVGGDRVEPDAVLAGMFAAVGQLPAIVGQQRGGPGPLLDAHVAHPQRAKSRAPPICRPSRPANSPGRTPRSGRWDAVSRGTRRRRLPPRVGCPPRRRQGGGVKPPARRPHQVLAVRRPLLRHVVLSVFGFSGGGDPGRFRRGRRSTSPRRLWCAAPRRRNVSVRQFLQHQQEARLLEGAVRGGRRLQSLRAFLPIFVQRLQHRHAQRLAGDGGGQPQQSPPAHKPSTARSRAATAAVRSSPQSSPAAR